LRLSHVTHQTPATAINLRCDGGPVCNQPIQGWHIGLTTTCGSTNTNSNFTNEVQISEKANVKSLVINADPIQCEMCNPARGVFRQIVAIRPDPDSRSGFTSISTLLSKTWLHCPSCIIRNSTCDERFAWLKNASLLTVSLG